jgi:mannan polymerase II complex MNN11 subunit
MHFAYPPRKSSNPPPFRPRSSKFPRLPRSRRTLEIGVVAFLLLLLYLFTGSRSHRSPYHEHVPSGDPPVVIVTLMDPSKYSSAYMKTVIDNRKLYAAKHGYEVFLPNAYDYDTGGYKQSWAKVMAMRHAVAQYPDAGYIWFLDQNAYIMDTTQAVHERVADPKNLDSMMIRDKPIVPPDSIIKTFAHMRGKDVSLVISHDKDGIISDNVLIKNGEWAKYFTELWFDPLYRSYNFQKAERHALEHMVQWHPTILSKIALIPQRQLGTYTRGNLGEGYQDGDFVVVFAGCSPTGQNSCEQEAEPYYKAFLKENS